MLKAVFIFCLFIAVSTKISGSDHFKLPFYPSDTAARSSSQGWELILQKSSEFEYGNAFFFHLHVPKTGGTNFQNNVIKTWQENNCGIGETTWPWNNFNQNGYKNFELSKFLEDKTCKVLTFQADYLNLVNYVDYFYNDPNGVKNTTARDMLVMTFVRAPIDHVRSLMSQGYITHINKNKTKPNPKSQRCLDPKNLKHFYDPDQKHKSQPCTSYQMQNNQVHTLGLGSVSRAKHTLSAMFAVGLASHYEESVCLFQYQLGQMNPKACSCEAIAHHRETGAFNAWESRKGLFHLTDDDIRRIEQITAQDRMLYEHASLIFYHRVMKVKQLSNVSILCDDDWLHGIAT